MEFEYDSQYGTLRAGEVRLNVAESFGAIVVLGENEADDLVGRFDRRLCGMTAMEVLDRRIRLIGKPQRIVLLLPRDVRELRESAEKLTWDVVISSELRVSHAFTVLRSLKVARWLRLDLRFPFVDPEIAREMLDKLGGEGQRVQVRPTNPLAPLEVFTSVALKRMGWNRLLRRSNSAGNGATPDHDVSIAGKLPACLTIDTADDELIEKLGGVDFSMAAVEELVRDSAQVDAALAEARDRLADRVSSATHRFRTNQRLARFEMEHGFFEMKAMPQKVGFNIARVCNARCTFCAYGTAQSTKWESPNCVSLEQIQSLDWLDYMDTIGIGADVGDAMLNPDFDAIITFFRRSNPQIKLDVLTNGLSLTRERCDRLVGEIETLRISLNAARRETWEGLMRTRGFDKVVEHIAYISRRKKEEKTSWPNVLISAVLTRENVEQLTELVELCHRLGVQMLNLEHFDQAIMEGCDMEASSSLYFHRDLADVHFEAAAKRAEELGLDLAIPGLFRDLRLDDEGFNHPRVHNLPTCNAPWVQCMFVFRADGRPEFDFCCNPIGKGVLYSWNDLSEATVRELWNHPTLQFFRSTVNAETTNRVCRICRHGHAVQPDGQGAHERAAGLEEIRARSAAGNLLTVG